MANDRCCSSLGGFYFFFPAVTGSQNPCNTCTVLDNPPGRVTTGIALERRFRHQMWERCGALALGEMLSCLGEEQPWQQQRCHPSTVWAQPLTGKGIFPEWVQGYFQPRNLMLFLCFSNFVYIWLAEARGGGQSAGVHCSFLTPPFLLPQFPVKEQLYLSHAQPTVQTKNTMKRFCGC